MTNGYLFKDPKGKTILEKVAHLFQTSTIFIADKKHLLFVCGGQVAANSTSSRKRFINAIIGDARLAHLEIILAESAYGALGQANDYQFVNIHDFEQFIADLATCIMIFVESPGTIAELGVFSTIKEIAKKALVVIDINHQTPSFINKGPIDKIVSISRSKYGAAVIFSNIGNPTAEDLEKVFEKLLDAIPNKPLRRKFEYTSINKLRPKTRLISVLEVINLFNVIRWKDRKIVFETIYGGRAESANLDWIISILVGMNLVRIYMDEHAEPCIASNKPAISFLESEDHSLFAAHQYYSALKIEILEYYQSINPALQTLWEAA